MADAYSRMSDTVAALSVHQGPGLTNAMTGITEAAKSRTPMLVLAAEATQPLSNFHVDQMALARAVGADAVRITHRTPPSPTSPGRSGRRSGNGARSSSTCPSTCRRPTSHPAPRGSRPPAGGRRPTRSRRRGPPRRGARRGAPPGVHRRARGTRCRLPPGAGSAGRGVGRLLATGAVASGLFNGNPWNVGISGGFSSPLARELISGADLIVGWGCALNMWTMSHGALIGPGAIVAQVDLEADALGRHRPIDVGVVGDVGRRPRPSPPTRPAFGRGVSHPGRRRAHRGTHPVERRADRGPVDGRPHRPAGPQRLARRDPPRGADRRHRLRQLPGLPQRLPRGARRVRLLHDPGLPVDRPRTRHRDRRRPRPAAPAAGRRARRRRRADGRQRARHRRPPRAADGRRRLRRRGVRRRGPPLRGSRPQHVRVPRHRHRGHRQGLRVRGRHGAHATISVPCSAGWTDRGTRRCCSTPRSSRISRHGGSRRRSAATDGGRCGVRRRGPSSARRDRRRRTRPGSAWPRRRGRG